MVFECDRPDMSTDTQQEDQQSAIRVYVSEEQKREWGADANDLGMNQSEFVRQMVQAGRRDLLSTDQAVDTSDGSKTAGADLERQVLETLSEADYTDWDELIQVLTGNIEERLEDTLDRLQRDDKVRYSGRNGGYTLASNDE